MSVVTETAEWLPADQLPAETWTLDGLVFGGGVDPATGCEYYASEVTGWLGAPAWRTNRQAALGAHGEYSGPQWREGRTITIEGRVACPTEQAREAAERRIGALCDDPTATYDLVRLEPSGPVRAGVRLGGETLVSMGRGRLHLDYSIPLYAPDPRKYLPARSAPVRLPTPGTGLDWQRGLASVTRTNLARNTIGSGYPAWTNYNGNSVQTVQQYTSVFLGAAARPYLARASATTAGIVGSSQPVPGIQPSTWYTVSVYVRPTATRDVMLSLAWTSGGAQVSVTGGTPVTVTANTWTRIQLTAQSPSSGVDSVTVSTLLTSASVGDLLDSTALLVEQSSSGATAGTYFDGSTPGSSWQAGAWASPSYNALVGLDWATGGGLNWGTPSTRGAAEITPGGTAETWPLYRIDGPTNPADPALALPTISLSSGEVLTYLGTISRGEYLLIDTHPLRRGVLLNGTTRRRSLLSNPQWGAFPPDATTTVAFTAASATPSALLTVTWSPALA